MRRLAQIIVGLLALGLMCISLPWELLDCNAGNCSQDYGGPWYWYLLGPAIYMGLFCTILTVVLVGVLGIRDSGQASQGAVFAALGQSQSAAAKLAAKTGAKDALAVVGGAFVVSGIIELVLVYQAGLTVQTMDPSLVWTRLAMAVTLSASLVVAHVVDALRPRRTPVERLYEDAAPPRPRRISLRVRALALSAIVAVGVGVLIGAASRYNPTYPSTLDATQTVAQSTVIGIAFALIAMFFAVGVPLARMAIPAAARAAAKVTGAVKATTAAAILRDRAATASGTSAKTVMAVAGLAFLAGALAAQDPAPALTPTYLGTVTITPAGLGEEVAPEYEALPGVAAVVPATLHGEWPQFATVDPAQVEAHDPVLAELIRDHPGAIITSTGAGGWTIGDVRANGIESTGLVPISTCCMSFAGPEVSAPDTGTALLIYAQDGVDLAATADAIGEFVPQSTNVTGLGASMAYSAGWSTNVPGVLFLATIIAIVCLGPVIALAVGVANRRRREDATLAALGASRRTLAAAAVIETTVVAAVAIGVGLAGGAAMQAVLAMCSRLRQSLNGVITDSYLDVAFSSVAWGTLAWMFAVPVAIFALVAWLVSLRAPRSLPAELLQSAEKGVLR